MNVRRINWPLWVALLLTLAGFMSYFFIFVWIPFTRDFRGPTLCSFCLQEYCSSGDCDVASLRIARIPCVRRSSAYW